jgi:hypothetical protein
MNNMDMTFVEKKFYWSSVRMHSIEVNRYSVGMKFRFKGLVIIFSEMYVDKTKLAYALRI